MEGIRYFTNAFFIVCLVFRSNFTSRIVANFAFLAFLKEKNSFALFQLLYHQKPFWAFDEEEEQRSERRILAERIRQ